MVTVAGMLIRADSDRKLEFDLAKEGDFVDPQMKPMPLP